MDRRKLFLAVAALVLVVLAVFGLATRDRGLGDNPDKVGVSDTGATEGGGLDERALQALCASSGVAARLKQVAFEEAFRIRNSDPTNLDRLAASSVVRLETPAVRSFDDGSDIVTCAGRFVLELPPGAERAFNGERRLTADVEYSVQAATGGPATVVQMNGAEPLIYRLAAFDLQNAPPPPDAIGNEIEPADAASLPVDGEAGELEEDEPVATPAPRPTVVPAPRPTAPPPPRASSNPSFNCRNALSRGEEMVCGSTRLAAKDRAMASLYYSALDNANPRQRSELRRTRDRFLAYRDRCRDEACVAEAYDGRMLEIRDIMTGLE